MRPLIHHLVSALLVGGLACAPAVAETIATVDGTAIGRADVMRTLAQNPGWASSPRAGDLALNSLITEQLLAKQAEAQKLDRTQEFKDALSIARRGLLAQAAAAKYLKDHPITEQAIRARYDQIKANAPKKRYRVRHILLPSRDAANEVLEALKKGENFSNLAGRSVDTATAPIGGELGWQQPGSLAKPLMDAVEKLQPGQVAGPIELPNGWDVIQLLEVRDAQLPSYEQLKPTIEAQLRNEALQSYVQTLRDKADIKITPSPAAKPTGDK